MVGVFDIRQESCAVQESVEIGERVRRRRWVLQERR